MMKHLLPFNLMLILLGVGLATCTVSDVSFDLVLQHIQLLQSQVALLKSRCLSYMTPMPYDCADIREQGMTSSGVYTVYIGNPLQPTSVYCDMTTDGGRWLVFQRRQDGSVDFYKDWTQYKAGFGNPSGEYWLGNEAIHWLTTSHNKTYELRIDLADFESVQNTRYAKYSSFKIGSESLKYKLLTLGTYSGTAGDSLTTHVQSRFSTKDQDNDIFSSGSCAVTYKGAWWYRACHSSNLNGLYHHGSHTSYADGVNWQAWKGYRYSLKFSEMKIRPVY